MSVWLGRFTLVFSRSSRLAASGSTAPPLARILHSLTTIFQAPTEDCDEARCGYVQPRHDTTVGCMCSILVLRVFVFYLSHGGVVLRRFGQGMRRLDDLHMAFLAAANGAGTTITAGLGIPQSASIRVPCTT